MKFDFQNRVRDIFGVIGNRKRNFLRPARLHVEVAAEIGQDNGRRIVPSRVFGALAGLQPVEFVHHPHRISERVPVRIDVTEKIVPRRAVGRAQLFKSELPDAAHPLARIAEVRVGTVQKPLLLEMSARFGEKTGLEDRGVGRVEFLETEVDVAAVDAGFCEHERQIGQTGVTVRPKLYIACGISGQIQHTAGMEESAMIISINTDANAPINKIADYAITGKVEEVIPKMIKYYKQNSK